jgi:hypothetical protein
LSTGGLQAGNPNPRQESGTRVEQECRYRIMVSGNGTSVGWGRGKWPEFSMKLCCLLHGGICCRRGDCGCDPAWLTNQGACPTPPACTDQAGGLLPIVARGRPRGWGLGLGLGSTPAALTTRAAAGRSRKKAAAHGNTASLASVQEEMTDGDIALYLPENQASCSDWRGRRMCRGCVDRGRSS